MKFQTIRVAALVSIAASMLCVPIQPASTGSGVGDGDHRRTVVLPNTRAGKAKASSGALVRLPLSFEASSGQNDPRVKYAARGAGYGLFLTSTEAVIQFTADSRAQAAATGDIGQSVDDAGVSKRKSEREDWTSALRMKLLGADPAARAVGLDRLPGKSNYFIGSDPAKWRTNIPTYAKVKCRQVYPGIDLVYYGAGQELEYDFIVAPGADPAAVKLRFDGAHRVNLNSRGDLIIDGASGSITHRKPSAYQEIGTLKRPIACGYIVKRDGEVGFDVGEYDRSKALAIDPVMVYEAALRGDGDDSAFGIAVDSSGNAYITGRTTSTDFPVANQLQPRKSSVDAFVAKLNSAGTALIYSTYLGGSDVDAAYGIAVDEEGNAYIAGGTSSTDFPTTPGAFQRTHGGGGGGDVVLGDAFITKLNANGDGLAYSTYLGGGISASSGLGNDTALAIAINSRGEAFVTGTTFSPTFPTKKALQTTLGNGSGEINGACFNSLIPLFPSNDAFVSKLNRSGSKLIYSTYLGGGGSDEGRAIAVDSDGNAYVAGRTCSTAFPLAGRAFAGGVSDAFLVKLTASGKDIVYSRYIGGRGEDIANGVAVDGFGTVHLVGETGSADFPTTQAAFQRSMAGSVVYRTDNGGSTWEAAASGLPNGTSNVLAVDPMNPAIIYAGLGTCTSVGGVFKSTDGGSTWKGVRLGGSFSTIAIDPRKTSTVYAGNLKSTDGGETWTAMPIGRGPLSQLVVDPVSSNNVYATTAAAGCSDIVEVGRVLKSSDGGASWTEIGAGLFSGVATLAIDPFTPTTVYANTPRTLFDRSGNVLKSTDGGRTWGATSQTDTGAAILVIDPSNPSTLYAGPGGANRDTILKSTDAGVTWHETGLTGNVTFLLVVPLQSSILYAATGLQGRFGGEVLKSTDGGTSWNATRLAGMNVLTLAINHLNSAVYAGVLDDRDAFAVDVNQVGEIVYSTFLGGRGHDGALGVAVDGAGNAYATGQTRSEDFPQVGALPSPVAQLGTVSPFVSKLTRAHALSYSTYIGRRQAGGGTAIAADAAGKIYIALRAASAPFDPESRGFGAGNLDSFILKLATPPVIIAAAIQGKKLLVNGEGFDIGAVILLDGEEQKTVNDSANTSTVLIARRAGKRISPGQMVKLRVRNADGMMTEEFSFTR